MKPTRRRYSQRAAQRAGFRDVVFQYEPVAAGLDFEASLSVKKNACWWSTSVAAPLDCSVLLMGPQWRTRHDRAKSARPQRLSRRR